MTGEIDEHLLTAELAARRNLAWHGWEKTAVDAVYPIETREPVISRQNRSMSPLSN